MCVLFNYSCTCRGYKLIMTLDIDISHSQRNDSDIVEVAKSFVEKKKQSRIFICYLENLPIEIVEKKPFHK